MEKLGHGFRCDYGNLKLFVEVGIYGWEVKRYRPADKQWLDLGHCGNPKLGREAAEQAAAMELGKKEPATWEEYGQD